MRHIEAIFLGTRPYDPVHRWMLELGLARQRGEIGDTLLLLEHEPVITLGRAAQRSHVLVDEAVRAAEGIALAETGRGGDVTYHGPGQLVGYPILDLKPDRCDVRRYVADLCRVMTRVLSLYGIDAGPLTGKVGVWVDQASVGRFPGEASGQNWAKIGAVGVRLSRWISTHGFALNASPKLAHFGMIVPCGIREYGVTSIADLTGRAPNVRELAHAVVPIVADVFEADTSPLRDLSDAPLSAMARCI